MARGHGEESRVKVAAEAQLFGSAEVKTNLAKQLLLPAASYFDGAASGIQEGQEEDRALESRMFALAAVLCSVAYMEAAINGYFIAASEATGIDGLDPEVCAALARAWRKGDCGHRFKGPKGMPQLLRKYRAATKIITDNEPNWGDSLREAAMDLVLLRNHLIHYGAYWPSALPEQTDALVGRLHHRFDANPFYPEPQNEYWPKGVLGSGCASWAVETADGLVKWFERTAKGDVEMDTTKYRLQVNCKNPECREAFTIPHPEKEQKEAEYDTQHEAVETLAGLMAIELGDKNKTLWKLIHDEKPVEVGSALRLQTCPACERMYCYRAEEIFIQMPHEST